VDVDDHLRAGTAAWPGIVVERERYVREVERHNTALEVLKGADLYVAIACVDGNEDAIEAVRKILAAEVGFAATKTTASRDQIAEVTASLSRVLFVDEPERPAALRAYSARGDLKSYLRVIAMRELVRVVNLGRREVGVGDDDFIDRIVPASDPEISILRERYRGDVDGAMRAALGKLDERERALLRYAFVDNMNVDAVGKLYDVHRATAARWIASAREQLGEKIRDELAARLKVDVDEVDSIVRLVSSRIDVSLDRVLKA
jgi:RNA polymerase sigma-70 factor (ECF subfamily)